jgi:hypothetical protein
MQKQQSDSDELLTKIYSVYPWWKVDKAELEKAGID